jgi:hypothetical protein
MMNKNLPVFFIFGFLFILTGCALKEDLRPERDCLIEQLLLDRADYPPETVLNDSRSPIAEMPLESAGGSANYQGTATSQLVARFFSVDNAVAEYEKTRERLFAPTEVVGVWETPPTLKLDSMSADLHRIACGNVVSFGNRCFMIGQYEEYYVFFRADISGRGITHELFRDLVLKIDQEISSCLDR